MWPFHKSSKAPRRNTEVEKLKAEISSERTKLYGNLVKLEDATRSFEKEGVRGMLDEMFNRLDEAKNRG